MRTAFSPQLHHTANGTPYFREAGVALVAQTSFNVREAGAFLDGFDAKLDFAQYLNDPDAITDADRLVKFAGQACYMSFGRKRTMNKDASRYFNNIKSQSHGSIMEHASFSLLFWGVDRTLTHELVRHRAGFAFSQVSQRYVGADTLRFVERRERDVQADADTDLRVDLVMLHEDFRNAIDAAKLRYIKSIERMEKAAANGHPAFQAESATERRKKIHQVARDLLPNCVEAPILVTGNVRAWRHMIEMRAHPKADTPIRDAAVKALEILREVAPLCFEDYKIVDLDDGTRAAETEFRKV